jgi:hypothetical protein
MSSASGEFLAALQAAADRAAATEAAFRREAAQRIAALVGERSFAFRRLNLMRAVAEAVAGAESEAMVLVRAGAALRDALGWSVDSEARAAVIERFAPVAQAAFNQLTAEGAAADVLDPLADFEAWYAATHPAPFWALFDHYVTETPLVDF